MIKVHPPLSPSLKVGLALLSIIAFNICRVLILPTTLFAQKQNPKIAFKPLPVAMGHVNKVIKTSDGFMWTCTQDGLFRYDGYEMKAFRPTLGDSTSLSSAFIWTMQEDAERNLWLGTFGQGLAAYNPRKDIFSSYPLPAGSTRRQSVRSLLKVKAILYVGTEDGLWEFDQQEHFHFLGPTIADSTNTTSIEAIQPLPDGRLLIGTSQGLQIYSPQEKTWEPTFLTSTGVKAILVDHETIWIGSLAGLYQVTYQDQQIQQSNYYKLVEDNPLAQAVNTLYLDQQNTLWIGTLKGFYQLPTRESNRSPLLVTPEAEHPLPDLHINSIYQVEPGLMWVGSRQGISTFSNARPRFHKLNQLSLGSDLCSNVILGSVEDEHGNWWLGTQQGLAKIETSYQNDQQRIPLIKNVECYTPGLLSEMPEAYVINLRITQQEKWVTFWRGGLRKMIFEDGQLSLSTIPGLAELTENAGIHDILVDQKSKYWIATPNRGIIHLDRQQDSFHIFEPQTGKNTGLLSPYIFYLMEDQQQRIWAGTANGGLCYKAPSDTAFQCFLYNDQQPASLSNNVVLSIFQDRQSRIWACTAGGLNLWLEKGRFQKFGRQEGLPSEVIYGMLQDEEGQFWLSTNEGLVRMHETENGWQFQVFTQEDGLQGNEFNQYAFFKTQRGLLCFGGPNGLTYFDPQEIQAYPHPPRLAFTDFQLFNQSQQVGGVLKQTINETQELRLSHQENFLAFEIAALGYTQSEGNSYAYQLLGLDQDWIYAGSRRYISYPNLAPGHYTLQVKAANHDGVWSNELKTIEIHILPPWWQRWWAYAIFFLLGILAIFLFLQLRIRAVRRLEQARQQEREAFRKKTAQDFHDEAGNKITKMALLAQVIQQQQKPKHEATQKLWHHLEQNIQDLRTGMRDFIWVLDPLHDNLYDTLLRLKRFGQELFEHSTSSFSFPSMEEEWRELPVNSPSRRHLLLIFKEAMHNSLKHANAQQVTFTVSRTTNELQLLLRDDGDGLTSNLESSGQGLRNMQDRAKKIGGQLAFKTPQEGGCEVQLLLQIPQMGH